MPLMEDEKQQGEQFQGTSSAKSKPLRCIVKLGGAAITCKNEFETINEEGLDSVSLHLREAIFSGCSRSKVLGMDWSKRKGLEEIASPVDEFRDQPNLDALSFVVVHGAGSFGHFQASLSGVHKGGINESLVKAGFAATRISVTTLNLAIVRALARGGIPSVGLSPFSLGWSTCQRNIASADISVVAKAIDSGFVPVLHGDAVLDDSLGCTILSGDVIIRHLAARFKPEYVVFLTDVLGVYDRPPEEPNAVLIREIAVKDDGSWSIVNPVLQNMNKQVETTVAAHDTTGGMATKISEASMIAKLGIVVYIVKAATPHALKALTGELQDSIPDDWLGTVIRCIK